MKLYYNNYRNDLYCIYCKEKIHIGEKYVIVEDYYMGELIELNFHVNHAPVIDETDEVYISEEQE